MNTEQNNEVPLEVMAPTAIMSIEKAAVDSQIATAHTYPRSLAQFRKRLVGMVTDDVATAESCFYRRPVGKDNSGRVVFADGESIRLAEMVAACYGNLRVQTMIVEQTPRYVKAQGAAWDLEANYAGKAEVIESTVKSNGQPYGDRQRALVAKVAAAKAYRDAVFKVVPKGLIKHITEQAKSVVAGSSKTFADRIAAVRNWLSGLKITDDRVFTALGIVGWDDCNEDHMMTLTGLRTSMRDGDVTHEEAFPYVTKTRSGGAVPTLAGPEAPPEPPEQKPAPKKRASKKKAAAVKDEPAQTPEDPPEAPEPPPEGATEAPSTPEPAPEAPDVPEADDVMEDHKLKVAKVMELCGESEIDPKTLKGHLVDLGIMKSKQDLEGLAAGKLANVIKGWATIIEEING